MTKNLSEISDSIVKESTDQWLSSDHCVYVGNRQDIIDWSTTAGCEDNFLVADRNSDGCWLFGLKYLDWDTKHFQMKMGKVFPFITPNADPHSPATLQWAQNKLAQLLSKAKSANYDYLSVLAHPEDTVGQFVLTRAGFELMDTTVLYELELSERIAMQTDSSIKLRVATEADIISLQEISEICFGERKNNINRFNSDPHLDQDKVKDLYRQWIYNSLGGRNMADLVIIAQWENQLAGFLTLKLDQETKMADIPLNAVNPRFSGHGIYKAMVNYALDFLIANEFKRVEIWTHVTNFAVQKTWQKLGARAKFCAHQYRLMLEV
jgi:GNAT superfamily N-acetyltransferase